MKDGLLSMWLSAPDLDRLLCPDFLQSSPGKHDLKISRQGRSILVMKTPDFRTARRNSVADTREQPELG